MRRIESSNMSSPVLGPTPVQYHIDTLNLVRTGGVPLRWGGGGDVDPSSGRRPRGSGVEPSGAEEPFHSSIDSMSRSRSGVRIWRKDLRRGEREAAGKLNNPITAFATLKA